MYWPEVLLRRWRNELGRTMWDFPGGRSGGNRYLVLGHGTGTTAEPVPQDREPLIAYGPLLSDDGAAWLGTAALVQAPDLAAARAVLTPQPVHRDRGAQVAVRRPEMTPAARDQSMAGVQISGQPMAPDQIRQPRSMLDHPDLPMSGH